MTTDTATTTAQNPALMGSFGEFYPFYLSEHSNLTCRRLHFVGSTLVLLSLAAFFVTGLVTFLVLVPFLGYGFAWFGHFGFEKNKPASFKRPLYSLMGDWVMYKDILTGKVKI
jgi:hypothetical protein